MADDKKNGNDPVIARNRKAYHDYEILETMEAGLELHGTEVKSCRMGSVQLQESFAKVENEDVTEKFAEKADGKRNFPFSFSFICAIMTKKEAVVCPEKAIRQKKFWSL